ncbi:MAG: G5 domain-containing protein, partial [Bacillota bacterium]|nr:G5 domain-containing protein [Bacillota bacterium]
LQRAVPVFVYVDGHSRLLYSVAESTAELLEQAGIRVGLEDRVAPGLNEKPQHGTKIMITRVNTELVTEEGAIPFKTENRQDDSLPRGRRKTLTQGKPGTLQRTFAVTYSDGEEESRELIEEKRVSEPVNAVVLVGTAEEAPIITASARSGRVTGEVIEGLASHGMGANFTATRPPTGISMTKTN